MHSIQILGIISLLCCSGTSHAQSILDKKSSLKESSSGLDKNTEQLLSHVNQETEEIENRIKYLYEKVYVLYQEQASEDQYKSILDEINENKRRLNQLENTWREAASKSDQVEKYGLWHAPETTFEQLIIDYGSQDYVYLIPPEVGALKLSVDSNLPIPRASWSEMLELILNQNGIGIKTLNPYLRQLYLVKQDNSNIRMITNNSRDLDILPQDARVSFVLSPEYSEVRRVYVFLEKFINPYTTGLHVLGRDILIIGPVADIQELLKLYDFIASNRGDKEYRLVPVFKIKAEEMAKILNSVFDQNFEKKSGTGEGEGAISGNSFDPNGLKIIVLEHNGRGIFLVGTKDEVRKAEEIILDIEAQISGTHDKTVFWYNVKHSEAGELADILYRVYNLMVATGTGSDDTNGDNSLNETMNNRSPNSPILPPPQREPPPTLYGQEGFYQEGEFIVNPAPAQPGFFRQEDPNGNRDNFIVDIKTGSIVMVVEADVLTKLKELIRKLDVPKRMVQIETLLFEKILNRENNFGLNLLKLGDVATQSNMTGAWFNNVFHEGQQIPGNRGVFDFFLSREGSCTGVAGFDLSYRFLLSQDDVQINSSPSILTLNQTPATIQINEDISINTGVFEVETAKGVTLKDAFTRAQYGITISIKPTIHMHSEDGNDCSETDDYVTLESDITFDTIQPGSHSSRPDVTRRHIKNQTNVIDGQTVVLGGLRRKVTHDNENKLPFLGDMPGFGKLFGSTSLKDSSSEMFIFITPHIVKDPKDQLNQLRQDLLAKRPGDIPYFLECLEEAHRYEKNRLLQSTITMLIGRSPPRYYIEEEPSEYSSQSCTAQGEYDGR